MKTNPTNPGLISKTVLNPARGFPNSARFQVVVEFAAGVCIPAAAAECAEEAVEAFLVQAPGCEDGEIALYDRAEQCVVASVKWAMETMENGLRVSHRKNIFQDWHLALIALEVQNRRTAQAEIKRSA